MDILKSHSYIRALWSLLPFFLLHLSSGLSGSFTTILIEQFGRLYKEDSANQNVYETLLGTLEDYCPIFVAILGGFLQQLFGPKKILIAAGIPNFISWILIAIDPTSLYFLLGSRLLAGFSNGLLTGNVYMADISPSKYITSFKSIEAASRSMGAILMFAIAIIFNKYGFRYVVIVASIFPMFGLIGIVFSQESPIFQERVKEIRISVESQESGETHSKSFSDRWIEAKKMLKIPIKSPAVYQPMILIICALCIQHFSGFTFTKKFLLQVLKSPTHHGFSNSSSLNETKLLEEIDPNGYDEKAYMFAMLINFIRFFSNVMMARFLRTLRMRLLYFISLFSTSLCLVILGFLVEGKMLAPYFSSEADQYLKVLILGVHVFCVQFGLQTLQGQLTDVLLPSSSKAIMKGFIRAIQALTLIVFVIIMKQFPDYVSFWIMATGLIFVCPLLYTYIPELKNLNRKSG